MVGRRPTLLAFDPSAGFVIGVDLGGTHLEAALADLAGNVTCQESGEMLAGQDGAGIVGALRPLLKRLVDKAGIDRKRILSLGVATPGIVEPESGNVAFPSRLGWGYVPLGEDLRTEFGIPAFVENDVNAAAQAERLFGAGREIDDFAFIFVGRGIGAGLIINGELYRGHGNLAGEIGDMVVEPGPAQGGTQGPSCLESLASAPAMIRRTRVAQLTGSSGADPGQDEVDALFRLAADGDDGALAALSEASRYLAIAIGNLVCVLGPKAVMLGGVAAQAEGQLLVEMLKANLRKLPFRLTEVAVSALGSKAGIRGAVSIAVRQTKLRLLDEEFHVRSINI